MSGGHFEYKQFHIEEIAGQLEKLIKNNQEEDEYGWKRDYPVEILNKFKEGLYIIKKAAIFTQRIDWLVSGDDGETSFFSRLEEELEELDESIRELLEKE